MEPLISVIVPVYKVEPYIRECVDSIINQTYRNLEIILVDDGSPDRCGKICDEYAGLDKRIKVIHKINGGLSSARNAGLDICKGEYISLIDSDDYISPYFIEMFYKASRINDSDVVTGTGASEFLAETDYRPALAHSINECEMREIEPSKALELMLYRHLPNGAPFRLYKKHIFDDIRYPEGYVFEDLATTHKTFIKARHMTLVKADIYAYRVRKDSILRMKFDERKMVVVPIAQNMFAEVCKAYPELEAAAASRAFAQCYHVLLQVPREDKKHLQEIWYELKKYRIKVITDRNPLVRKKDKVGAWISLFGMNISYLAGRTYLKAR